MQRWPKRKTIVTVCGVLGAFLFIANLSLPFNRVQYSSALGGNAETAPTKQQDFTAPSEPSDSRKKWKHKGQVVKQVETHIYRKDGLLEVNPNGPHPIFELIKRAQEAWEEKMKRSSKTLDQAVIEYQHRYSRMPPRGFDHWWNYVVKHNVQLPDEYDQIYRDLEPFWGMDPNDLQRIQRKWEVHADSVTIGKDTFDEPISIKNYSLPSNDPSPNGLAFGVHELMNLLGDVGHLIPPFHAIFSPHDNPNLLRDYELNQLALQAAKSGKFIDVNNPPKSKLDGWISACAPDSPARTQPISWGGPPSYSSTSKTFIYDHRASMDPCLHPSHFLLHGQFVSHHKGPVPHRNLIPQFSNCRTMLHEDISPAMPNSWIDDIFPRQNDPEWDDRLDSRLQWRGSNTGIWHAEDKPWDLSHRSRLVYWAGDGLHSGKNAFGENITVLLPVDAGKPVGKAVEVAKSAWAPAMVDVAFAGRPMNCPPNMCETLDRVFEFRKRQDAATAGRYKYYVDVDGNGWSSRFKRLITSNALVFKSTIYPEWFLDRVAPWVHYVPIQNDLSDLWDALVFFRGDPGGNGAHESLAKEIGKAGREWSKSFWRKEDMVAYMFRLFLEYSRVMDPDRNSLFYDPSTGG